MLQPPEINYLLELDEMSHRFMKDTGREATSVYLNPRVFKKLSNQFRENSFLLREDSFLLRPLTLKFNGMDILVNASQSENEARFGNNGHFCAYIFNPKTIPVVLPRLYRLIELDDGSE